MQRRPAIAPECCRECFTTNTIGQFKYAGHQVLQLCAEGSDILSWRLLAGKYFSVLVIFCARCRKNKKCVHGAQMPESKKPTAEGGLSA